MRPVLFLWQAYTYRAGSGGCHEAIQFALAQFSTSGNFSLGLYQVAGESCALIFPGTLLTPELLHERGQ